MPNIPSVASSRELASLLIKWFPTQTIDQSSDSSGNPVITISDGTPAAGEAVVVIRTLPISWPDAKDVLGLPQQVYSGDIVQFCTEASSGSVTLPGFVPISTLLPLIVEIGREGHFVEWYQSANGTVPAVAQMVAANLQGSWRDLYWNVLKAI